MTTEEVKLMISDRTSLPLHTIKGSTPEEAIAYSKSILEYREKVDELKSKSKADGVGALLFGEAQEKTNPEMDALIELQMELGLRNSYPEVIDGGEIDISNMPDPRTPEAQFSEWVNSQLAYNPGKHM